MDFIENETTPGNVVNFIKMFSGELVSRYRQEKRTGKAGHRIL
jgi:hypothetical protein